MAFPDLLRPSELRFLLGPRVARNQNGFQGAHIIGDAFWRTRVRWLDDLKFQNGANTLNNGVLLPESERGSAVLGAATHRGVHFPAFDGLFYNPEDEDDVSNLYLNKTEDDLEKELMQASIVFEDDPIALMVKEEEIYRDYRIRVRNLLDFAKILLLYDEKLDSLGFGDLESLVLNTTDPRFVGEQVVRDRFAELANFQGDPATATGPGIFDYGEVTSNPLFNYIQTVRGDFDEVIDC